MFYRKIGPDEMQFIYSTVSLSSRSKHSAEVWWDLPSVVKNAFYLPLGFFSRLPGKVFHILMNQMAH